MIDRSEFLKMAWDCGFEFEADEIAMDKDVIARFSNAILERAAVVGQLTAMNGIEVASAIRALKTQGE